MHLSILLYLLIAHFVSDFIFQSHKTAEARYAKNRAIRVRANAKHSFVHFIIAATCVVNYLSWKMLFLLLLLSMTHLMVDLIKSRIIIINPNYKHSPWLFIGDQLAHLLLIIWISYWGGFCADKSRIIPYLMQHIGSIVHTFSTDKTPKTNITIAILLLIVGLWGVGIFIRIFLENMRQKSQGDIISPITIEKKNTQSDGALDGGLIIGILERLFIIIAMILNIPEIIGFVLTAKSIARLKKFEDDRFVEEFIIGSFISFISAIAIGILIRSLNVLPLWIKW